MPTTTQVTLRTKEQARRWLDEQGLSISEFAAQNNLDRMDICDLLRGKRIGKRGKAHNAAVALGMKTGVIRDLPKRGRK
jgi:gp16 family phage-associated protein